MSGKAFEKNAADSFMELLLWGSKWPAWLLERMRATGIGKEHPLPVCKPIRVLFFAGWLRLERSKGSCRQPFVLRQLPFIRGALRTGS